MALARPADNVRPTKSTTNMATRKMMRWRPENHALPSENIRELIMESIVTAKVQSLCNLRLRKYRERKRERESKDRWREQHEKITDTKHAPHHGLPTPPFSF